MNRKFLITNSDDFGLNDSITNAIVETHVKGIMTSTTMMVNMPGFNHAIKMAKEHKSLGVGVHFTLTEGYPISQASMINQLLNEDGLFLNNAAQRKNLLFGREKLIQVERELTAQLTKLLDYGIIPTHFDSHHHITGLPIAFQASVNVAKKFKIKKARVTNISYRFTEEATLGLRIQYLPKVFLSIPKALLHLYNKKSLRNNSFQTPDTKIAPARVIPSKESYIDHFLNVLSVIEPGITEISFHPGYHLSNPNDIASTAALRVKDLEIATHPDVSEFIKKNKINLVNFNTAFNGK